MDVKELKSHFTKSLEHIRDKPKLCEISSKMYNDVCSQFSHFMNQKDDKNWILEIKPNWELPLLDDRSGFTPNTASALLGGIVKVENGCLSEYSFTLCLTLIGNSEDTTITRSYCNVPSCCLKDYRERKRVVRKFHFDVDPTNTDRPISHLQYGGILSIGEDIHYCLEHKIKKPRLPYPPMDFVLILDLLLEQFDNLRPLKEDNWNSLVKKSEEILMYRYYAKINGHFKIDKRKTLLEFLRDFNDF